ncbi:MAG: FHA domain-containing protein [Myxococcota bacterium]
MVRRTLRELEVADHLWDCMSRIAEDSGLDRDAIVNQAIYEYARRLNFLAPTTTRADPPEARPRANGSTAPDRGATGPIDRRASPAPRPAPRPEPKPKSLFIVNSGGDMQKVDKDTFIIGRSRTCDLVIPSSKVSRQHGGVSRENGEYYIEDLGSANGVWKDGIRIQKERITDGDEYMISEEVLKFIFR